MHKILNTFSFISICFFLLCGFGANHSSVSTKNVVEGQNVALQFIVKANDGMQLTKEGPWSLTLSNTQGLKLELKDGKYISKEYNEGLPGFEVKATKDSSSPQQGKIDYVLKAFVCSNDKKHCYPQTHKGSLDWKA